MMSQSIKKKKNWVELRNNRKRRKMWKMKKKRRKKSIKKMKKGKNLRKKKNIKTNLKQKWKATRFRKKCKSIKKLSKSQKRNQLRHQQRHLNLKKNQHKFWKGLLKSNFIKHRLAKNIKKPMKSCQMNLQKNLKNLKHFKVSNGESNYFFRIY